MADPARARKLAVRIRQIVSAAIESQIKDPRLGMVTVTDARVTSDLREATVFYTVYGDDTQVADSAKALASATGVLRSTVGRQTGIKFVPTLTFVADSVPDTARELDAAIERVRHADAELARVREGATYAGDADPYRRPAEALDDDGNEDGATGDGVSGDRVAALGPAGTGPAGIGPADGGAPGGRTPGLGTADDSADELPVHSRSIP